MKGMDDRIESATVVLSSNLPNIIDLHLAEAADDVYQTRLILDEAISKLERSFYGIQDELAQQRRLAETNGSSACADKLAVHLHQAIIGLQFHDLTDQLLQRVNARFDGLREMLVVMDYKKTMVSGYDEAEDLSLSLRESDEKLSELSVTLQNALSKSLRQQHMGSGDVELF
ncbi:hypothetical protein [Methylobacter sp. S3L5C]|uniref:hypothetical protein n=1 Tax=Methylobacter sp. S3L5C TaxID=2839024 RepID=UPI001FAC9834|nr:hypothetical protein [Methylobacter sp. S3L5C]UOA10489.1 hypothetical protein KKZ03_09805 [Methylobacter sp. S3L5C]